MPIGSLGNRVWRQVEWGIGCGERLTGEQDVPIVDWGIGCGDRLTGKHGVLIG